MKTSHLYFRHLYPSSVVSPRWQTTVLWVIAEPKAGIESKDLIEWKLTLHQSVRPACHICPRPPAQRDTSPGPSIGSLVLANRPLIAHLQLDKMLNAERVQSQRNRVGNRISMDTAAYCCKIRITNVPSVKPT